MSGKVDIVSVCVIVVASLEGYVGTIRSGTVPPFPAHLTRLDPVGVLQYGTACQLHGNSLLQDTLRVGYHNIAPGEGAGTLSLGNVISLFGNGPAAVATGFPSEGSLGEDGGDTLLVATEEYAGIVVHIAFANEQLGIVCTREQHGYGGQLVVVCPFVYPLFSLHVLITLLKRGVEVGLAAGLEVSGVAAFRNHGEGLVVHNHLALHLGNEAVSHGIVHYAQLHGVCAKVYGSLGVVVLNG